jgi:hypothetical protein
MPFTSSLLLKTLAPDALIDNFESANPDKLQGAIIPAIDAIVQRRTNRIPPDDPDAVAADKDFQLYCLWIAKYLMIDFQVGLSQDERDKRRRDYDSALKELERLPAVEPREEDLNRIGTTGTYKSVPRPGYLP